MTHEPTTERWRRRLLTIPGFILAASLYLLALPALLTLALLADLALRRRFVLCRTVLALGLYFACEALGLLASFFVWAAFGWRSPQAFAEANYRLQQRWARALLGGAMRLYGMRARVSGTEVLDTGPFLLFVRHASTIDTLLAANFVAPDRPYRLRYVIKRELLWDPCLDVVGQRIPNVFIRRGSGEGEREVEALRRLARDLGPDDGVLIYPEGTRVTAAKRKRALERIATADPERLARVADLRHVLPPRYGGPLGLVDERPDVDVVFLAHSGFDGVEDLNDLWSGALIGREIRIHFWRVAATEIPAERDARAAWLDAEWRRLDAWIEANAVVGQSPQAL